MKEAIAAFVEQRAAPSYQRPLSGESMRDAIDTSSAAGGPLVRHRARRAA